MIQIKVLGETDGWGGRRLPTVAWGYIDPGEVAAINPARSAEVDGNYQMTSHIVMKTGITITAIGYPEEVYAKLFAQGTEEVGG